MLKFCTHDKAGCPTFDVGMYLAVSERNKINTLIIVEQNPINKPLICRKASRTVIWLSCLLLFSISDD